MRNGEPTDNYENVITALKELDDNAQKYNIFYFSFSTIGENETGILKMAEAFKNFTTPVRVQLSLHAVGKGKRRFFILWQKIIRMNNENFIITMDI